MDVLATWDDFSGGHWGNLGPERAKENQWGGINVLLDGQGNVGPVSDSVTLTCTSMPMVVVNGIHWAWGSDQRMYFHADATQTTSGTIFRFKPNPATSTTTIQAVGFTTEDVPTYQPSWVVVNDTLYCTIYGDKTYAINTSAGTTAILTGSYGNAPAGRSICVYGERLVVGGISDSRFGTVNNRIVFSGDDSANNPTDRTAWETLNYFDVGPTDRMITGLYPTRDYLLVVMEDQTIWIVTGTLGTDAVARRYSGYQSGSGAVRNFKESHGAIDPSQTRVWLFDHPNNGIMRFNGASVTRVKEFGMPINNGPANSTSQGLDLLGEVTAFGGPDEILAMGTSVGASGYSTTPFVSVFRSNGAWALTNQVRANEMSNAGTSGSFLESNDRKQVVWCSNRGDGVTFVPAFDYWFAGEPLWDVGLQEVATYAPMFHDGQTGDFDLPFQAFDSKGRYNEAEVAGLLVEFIPRPNFSSSQSYATTNSVSFTVKVIGKGVASYAETISGTSVSGLRTSTNSTFSTQISTTDSNNWPNVRSLWFPLRLDRVTAGRVKFSTIRNCRIVRVRMLGRITEARLA